MAILRQDLFFVDLAGARGRETYGGKDRPVVVLSINWINSKPLVVAVVPGTTTPPRRPFRNVVSVMPSPANGLREETFFLCYQIRALDHSRFTTSRVGRLSDEDMLRIDSAVRFSLGLGVELPSR